jgi:hypothetical protein
MDLVNLCLKIPNLGILLYYLIFIVILPYILIYSNKIHLLKMYMPLMVAFAHLLTRIGDPALFDNLYQLNPIEFVPFLSSNFINVFALFGILWQCIEFSRKYNLTNSVIYGILVFMIALPFARVGLKFVLDQVDKYLKEKTDIDYKYNWHLIVVGLLYIIFILGLQAVLLTLVGFSGELTGKLNTNNKNNNNKLNNDINELENNKNNKNNTNNNTNKFLRKFNLSNMGNFNKRLA